MKIQYTILIKIHLLVLVSLSSISAVMAQINTELYYEKNIFGNQYGGILSWEFNKGLKVGGFYQFSLNQSNEKPVNNEFIGGYINLPIYRSNRLALSTSLKPGIANYRFIIIVPAIETTFRINKNISIASVAGLRAGSALFGIKSIFKISQNRNYGKD